jgi:hypothetical protein
MDTKVLNLLMMQGRVFYMPTLTVFLIALQSVGQHQQPLQLQQLLEEEEEGEGEAPPLLAPPLLAPPLLRRLVVFAPQPPLE